ncbi:MAG: DUF2812 domain-containing protein [Firmicutes bacterium]|nr:DUF2812 domain-containing protein [Bacillota bacterium]
MKYKDTMTIRYNYEYNELDSLAELLEEKAAEGWELTSKTGASLGFRKGRPRKSKFSVEIVYPDEQDIDNEQFVAYCRASGWNHVFSDGKLQIFETEDMEAEPIHTDPAVKLKIIHRKCWKSQLLLAVLGFAGTMAYYIFFLKNFDYYNLINNTSAPIIVGFPVLMLLLLLLTFSYIKWYLQAKRAVETGGKPVYKRRLLSRIGDKVLLIYIFIGQWGAILLNAYYNGSKSYFCYQVCFMAILVILLIGFPIVSARRNKERRGNFAVFMAVVILVGVVGGVISPLFIDTEENIRIDGFNEETAEHPLPLTVEDLGVQTVEERERGWKQNGSLFLQKFSGMDESQNEGDPFLYYTVYKGNMKRFGKYVLEYIGFSREAYVQVDGSQFGVMEAFYDQEAGRWVLISEDKIVTMRTNILLNEKQKAQIGKKLL